MNEPKLYHWVKATPDNLPNETEVYPVIVDDYYGPRNDATIHWGAWDNTHKKWVGHNWEGKSIKYLTEYTPKQGEGLPSEEWFEEQRKDITDRIDLAQRYNEALIETPDYDLGGLNVEKKFPEFYAQKPDFLGEYQFYWWDNTKEGWKLRQQALLNAIQLTYK